MSKLNKAILGAVVVWAILTVLHLHLNMGINLKDLIGKKDNSQLAQSERFRVGFLPVT